MDLLPLFTGCSGGAVRQDGKAVVVVKVASRPIILGAQFAKMATLLQPPSTTGVQSTRMAGPLLPHRWPRCHRHRDGYVAPPLPPVRRL